MISISANDCGGTELCPPGRLARFLHLNCKNHDTELPDISFITARDGADLLTQTVKKRTVAVISMVGLG